MAEQAGASAAAEGLRIGDAASRIREVTVRDIELFTELTGDRCITTLSWPGSVFVHVDWAFRAPVRPGDFITAQVAVTSIRDDKPVTTLSTTITNQDGVVVLDGTAVVWRDPAVTNG